MDNPKYIPYRQIAARLSISRGDVVLLTSDILKLAMKARKEEKEFISDPFINSFFEETGTEGTLLIPSYNFDLENGDSFDILKTEPMTGSLAVAALKDDSFVRTLHPLHSFLVKGTESEKLSSMENNSSFGPDSPFAWLLEKNALMVFAGTTVSEAMTFTHFVEESEQVHYRKYDRMMIKYTDRQGVTTEKAFKLYAKKPGWTMALHKLEGILPQDMLRKYVFNGIPFYTIRCQDAYEIISRDIRENNASSLVEYNMKLYFRDIIKLRLNRFNIFRTTYGKIRSAKRIR
jgi:aminoglycoside 3-N-acetyltransferase